MSGYLPEFISELAVLASLAVLVTGLLGWAKSKLPEDDTALVDAIEATLPHTQCAQCGYPGCRPYAEAVAQGEALDLCPPGGKATLIALKEIMGDNGNMAVTDPVPLLAVIDEARCIGCALCIPPCPVDAILGANKFLSLIHI